MFVQAVKMTALQTEQLLLWRDEHLRNMHAIYEQRQHLNLQVTSQLCSLMSADVTFARCLPLHRTCLLVKEAYD